MASKPDFQSIPPDTGSIDSDWTNGSPRNEVLGDEADSIETRIPSEPYEQLAKKVTADTLTSKAARRALSAPAVPVFDASILDEFIERISGKSTEMEATRPILGQQVSGPHAIPLEIEDDGQLRASERPTTPQLDPPIEYMAPTSRGKDSERQPPKQQAPGWVEEPLTPLVNYQSLSKNLAAAGDERCDEEPDVSVTVGEPEYLELDEPGGVGMEDSLEISLDDLPFSPFGGPAIPLAKASSSPASDHRLADDSLQLSLEGHGDALDLVAARATPLIPIPSDPLVDLRDRYAVGDFTGAYEIAEAILVDHPDNGEALRFRESCRDVLMQMYRARIGPDSAVPKLSIPTAELRWLSLDYRSGFLLSCIDGQSTVEEILDVSGMPQLEALRILYGLIQQKVVHISGT